MQTAWNDRDDDSSDSLLDLGIASELVNGLGAHKDSAVEVESDDLSILSDSVNNLLDPMDGFSSPPQRRHRPSERQSVDQDFFVSVSPSPFKPSRSRYRPRSRTPDSPSFMIKRTLSSLTENMMPQDAEFRAPSSPRRNPSNAIRNGKMLWKTLREHWKHRGSASCSVRSSSSSTPCSKPRFTMIRGMLTQNAWSKKSTMNTAILDELQHVRAELDAKTKLLQEKEAIIESSKGDCLALQQKMLLQKMDEVQKHEEEQQDLQQSLKQEEERLHMLKQDLFQREQAIKERENEVKKEKLRVRLAEEDHARRTKHKGKKSAKKREMNRVTVNHVFTIAPKPSERLLQAPKELLKMKQESIEEEEPMEEFALPQTVVRKKKRAVRRVSQRPLPAYVPPPPCDSPPRSCSFFPWLRKG